MNVLIILVVIGLAVIGASYLLVQSFHRKRKEYEEEEKRDNEIKDRLDYMVNENIKNRNLVNYKKTNLSGGATKPVSKPTTPSRNTASRNSSTSPDDSYLYNQFTDYNTSHRTYGDVDEPKTYGGGGYSSGGGSSDSWDSSSSDSSSYDSGSDSGGGDGD